MQYASFGGDMETTDRSAVEAIFNAWLGVHVKFSINRIGLEFSHESDAVSVYVHEDSDPSFESSSFLFEGIIRGSHEVVSTKLHSLASDCAREAIPVSIDYKAIDSLGNQLGEEQYIN